MATINAQAVAKRFPAAAADLTEFTWTAGAPTGDVLPLSGEDVLLAWNSDASVAYDLTINGEPDENGRDVTITKELAAGEFLAWGLVPLEGFANASRQLSVSVENAAIKWALIRVQR